MNLHGLRIDKNRTRRPRRRWPGRVALAGVALVLVFLLRAPLLRLYAGLTRPEVRAIRVEQSDPVAAGAVRGKAANGYVVAARRAALSSDFSGRIVEMNVREGSVVKKGDIVARLDSSEQAAAVTAAGADLEVAKENQARAAAALESTRTEIEGLRRQEEAARANVDAATARRQRARLELERVQKLAGQQVSTQSDLDDARSAADVAEADLESARAALETAHAAITSGEARENVAKVDVRIAANRTASAAAGLDRARAALEKTNIRAPFDGIVVLKDAEVGEVVSPFSQGGSNARGAVATMVDFASLEVQANVPETSLDAVVVGAPVEIFLDAWPDRPYSGHVDRIWPTADRQKGTIEVRCVFEKPDERLRPDLGVRVVFLPPGAKAAETRESSPREILLPEATIVRRDGGSAVFVLEGDRVRLTPIVTGTRRGGRVVVTDGVEEGERVVLDPPASLADGDRVLVSE